nr:hypothetical protein [Mycobacterium sp. UM_NZ2]
MSADQLLNSPAVAQAESEAVGQAVLSWLRDEHQCIEPVLSFCSAYSRARCRAVHAGVGLTAAVLDMAGDDIETFDLRIRPDEQMRLMGLIDSCVDEVSAGAVEAHRRRIAQLARQAATELVAETVPEAGCAALVWAGVTAEAMVLGFAPSSVEIGDPVAAAARREIAWRQANEGRWSESDYWVWIAAEGQQRALVDRVENMLAAEKIGAGE